MHRYLGSNLLIALFIGCLLYSNLSVPCHGESYRNNRRFNKQSTAVERDGSALDNLDKSYSDAKAQLLAEYQENLRKLEYKHVADLQNLSEYCSKRGDRRTVRKIRRELSKMNTGQPGQNRNSFEDSPYQGTHDRERYSSADRTNGWHDPYQGQQIERQVIVFQDTGFRGLQGRISAPGQYGSMDLTGIGNDELSSLQVPEGFSVTLYEHDGFKGRSVVYTEGNYSTVGLFNDLTSSILIQER